MKKKTLTWLLAFCPFILFGQEIDLFALLTCTEDNTIAIDKEQYKKVVIDVPPEDLFSFSDEGDEPNIKQTVTYYIDGDEIKLIIVSSECDQLWFIEYEQIEYHLKNDTVFYVYQHYQIDNYSFEDSWEVTATTIEEKKTYYDSSRPIRCFTKEAKGNPSEIDSLFQKTKNKEEDCTYVWRIGKSSISVFYDIDFDSFLEFYRKYGAQAKTEEIIIEKKTTNLYWINDETGEVVETIAPHQKVRLGFETQGYQKGEEVKARIQWKNGGKIKGNQTELVYSGIVDENGRAVSKEALSVDMLNQVKSE